MIKLDFEKIITAFNEYIGKYDMNNINIKLKYLHTLEVVKIWDQLATILSLDKESKELAKLIGLLHDIGRFEQVK